MSASLQHLVDTLAAQVGRGVALEDHRQRMVCHSAQLGEMDQLRVDSILNRDTADSIRKWYEQFDISQASGPIVISPKPELGMLGRLCVPVRYRSRLLGFLWLIDRRGDFSDEDVDLAAEAADSAAIVLYRERRLEGIGSDALRSLLLHNDEARRLAAEELAELELVESDDAVVVLVAYPAPGSGRPRRLRPTLLEALSAECRRATARNTLLSERSGHALLLLSAEGSWQEAAEKMARRLLAVFADEDPAVKVFVGIGDREPSLLSARTSYEQALHSARVACALAGEAIQTWEGLGFYRLLHVVGTEVVSEELLDPGFRKLVADARHAPLTETLECYLDLAGDAAKTADALAIHRTTLYQRLHKIERVTGTNMHDGDDRLRLHFSIRVERMLRSETSQ